MIAQVGTHTNASAHLSFSSITGVVPSPAPAFEVFAMNVNAYLEKPPFNHPNAVHKIGGMKNVSMLWDSECVKELGKEVKVRKEK